jgi:hypothetical protein
MSNLMKIHPVRAEWFHADGRTDGQIDMTKLTGAFRNFATAPKNWYADSLTVLSFVMDMCR